MEFIYERKINYYETDRMGVVHHSNYIRFLEEARCAHLESIGMPYSKLEEQGLMIPVLNVNCNYKYHVTFNDTLVITLAITEFTGVKMVVNYTLTNKETGDLIMTAETKHAMTDTNLKPVNTKKHFPYVFEKFSSVVVNKKN